MPFEHSNGRAWYAEIPELERLADNLEAYRSPVVVCENDRALGPAHSYHQDIAREGHGRFSHWGTALVFSTSDNSNPNTNGRSYLAIRTGSDIPLSQPPVQPASKPPAPPASAPAAPPAVLTPAQHFAGQIVELDKANHQMSFQREEPGQTNGAIEQFVLNHEPAYDLLKVGDRVAITIEHHNGVWKVTRYSLAAKSPSQ